MSLISLMYGEKNSFPILIGDLLISSPLKEGNISLPTFFNGIDDILPAKRNYFGVSIQQKIYIITDNIAIGLAGSVYEMRLFLSEIKNNFKYKESSWENIVTFIIDYNMEENLKNSSLILLHHTESVFNVVKFNCKEIFSNSFGKTFVSGSGSETFIETINLHIQGNETHENPNYDIFEEIIGRTIILVTKFLVFEKTSLTTLIDHWGAGFEMICWNGQKLLKLSGITHILLVASLNIDTRNISYAPIFIYNSKYQNDLLVLTVNDCQIKEIRTFLVPSIEKDNDGIEILENASIEDLTSETYSLTMIINYSDGNNRNTTFIIPASNIDIQIEKTAAGKYDTRFEIDPEFLNVFIDFSLKDLNL